MKAPRSVRKGSGPPLRITVKVTRNANPGECQGILSQLKGVQSVIQAFPEETDEDLKRLFVLEVEPSECESTLRELQRRSEVEYAEEAPLRKLVR